MSITPLPRLLAAALAVALAPGLSATPASAQSRHHKMDSVLQARAQQLLGRSRIIVQFKGDPDVRALGRGIAGRRLDHGAQVAEVDNWTLPEIAADPRVERVMVDRPTFASMERTSVAIGATLVREEFSLTGRGVGVAIIDSGISAAPDDLNRSISGKHLRRVVHFKDFTQEMPALN